MSPMTHVCSFNSPFFAAPAYFIKFFVNKSRLRPLFFQTKKLKLLENQLSTAHTCHWHFHSNDETSLIVIYITYMQFLLQKMKHENNNLQSQNDGCDGCQQNIPHTSLRDRFNFRKIKYVCMLYCEC